ncbi:MAG: helix-hairpin-helix domain-containing protein [Desulfurococcales archaeon]|nr:helix-hairpin-helix domain-containing protein [Desulfurococcales archaeon]
MKIHVYADVREENTGIPSLLESLGLTVIRKQLSIGDYVVAKEAVIERKSSYDFARSLFDGRLFDQAKRMVEAYPIVIYVVEGDPTRIKRYQSRMKQLYSAMITLTLDYNARIIMSSGPKATALIIDAIARRMAKEVGTGIVLHKKPRLSDLREWQLYIVQSFPFIGPKTAEKILDRFSTIEKFCSSSIAELSKIEGIGDKKAEFIRRILVTPYKKPDKDRRRVGKLDEFYGHNE